MYKINARAWIKSKSVMFYAGSLSGVGDFYMAQHKPDINSYERFMVDNIWMLGSGIEDQNGRQIFDGDIIEWNIFPDNGQARTRDQVIFSNGCFRTKERCELLATKEPFRQVTVIGNIYENPELLTE